MWVIGGASPTKNKSLSATEKGKTKSAQQKQKAGSEALLPVANAVIRIP